MRDQTIGKRDMAELQRLIDQEGLFELGLRYVQSEPLLLQKLALRHQAVLGELQAAGISIERMDRILREFVYCIYELVMAAHLGHRRLWDDLLPDDETFGNNYLENQ